jgi:2'-5' RNA ligase
MKRFRRDAKDHPDQESINPLSNDSQTTPSITLVEAAIVRKIGNVDGIDVFAVDGDYLRDNVYTDFAVGGNGQRYEFVPDDTVWVEATLAPHDMAATVVHEIIEMGLMRNGWSYENAHTYATEVETRFRTEVKHTDNLAHEVQRYVRQDGRPRRPLGRHEDPLGVAGGLDKPETKQDILDRVLRETEKKYKNKYPEKFCITPAGKVLAVPWHGDLLSALENAPGMLPFDPGGDLLFVRYGRSAEEDDNGDWAVYGARHITVAQRRVLVDFLEWLSSRSRHPITLAIGRGHEVHAPTPVHALEYVQDTHFLGSNGSEKRNKRIAGYLYSSTQLNLPKDLARKIKAWAHETIDPEDLYDDPDDPSSSGYEDHLHITLLYGLTENDPDVVEKLRETVKGYGPIKVTLGKVSVFGGEETGKPYDVVKLSVESRDLQALHKSIKENLENEQTWPTYKPHVTLAYVKAGHGQQYAGLDDFEGEEFEAEYFLFSPKDDKEHDMVVRVASQTVLTGREKEKDEIPSRREIDIDRPVQHEEERKFYEDLKTKAPDWRYPRMTHQCSDSTQSFPKVLTRGQIRAFIQEHRLRDWQGERGRKSGVRVLREAKVRKWSWWNDEGPWPEQFWLFADGRVAIVEGFGWHHTAMDQMINAHEVTRPEAENAVEVRRKDSPRCEYLVIGPVLGMSEVQKRLLRLWRESLPRKADIELDTPGFDLDGSQHKAAYDTSEYAQAFVVLTDGTIYDVEGGRGHDKTLAQLIRSKKIPGDELSDALRIRWGAWGDVWGWEAYTELKDGRRAPITRPQYRQLIGFLDYLIDHGYARHKFMLNVRGLSDQGTVEACSDMLGDMRQRIVATAGGGVPGLSRKRDLGQMCRRCEMRQKVTLNVGDRIYYGGDQANEPGKGTVTARVIDKWGDTVDVTMDDGRVWRRLPLASFSDVYLGHGGTRFVPLKAYEEWYADRMKYSGTRQIGEHWNSRILEDGTLIMVQGPSRRPDPDFNRPQWIVAVYDKNDRLIDEHGYPDEKEAVKKAKILSKVSGMELQLPVEEEGPLASLSSMT